jgi:membrane associated rhomboid family serine protease
MKKGLRSFYTSLPVGTRFLLLAYALGYPLALVGHHTHAFELYDWLGLSPAKVWQGQVWRTVSYGFLAASPVDWAVSLFWLATLAAVLGRNWSAPGFWVYCALGTFAGALPVVGFKPGLQASLAGAAAMIFALLVAWDWFYRNDRLILLGIGEISVRQATILIAVINSVILFFGAGWFLLLAMGCGGVAGWLYLVVRYKLILGKSSQQFRSERMVRLEL